MDGRVAGLFEEERLTRRRHAKEARIDNGGEWPGHAADRCLADAGLDWTDLDEVAYAFLPDARLANIGRDDVTTPGGWGSADGEARFVNDVRSVEARVRAHAGPAAAFRFTWHAHHLCLAGGGGAGAAPARPRRLASRTTPPGRR